MKHFHLYKVEINLTLDHFQSHSHQLDCGNQNKVVNIYLYFISTYMMHYVQYTLLNKINKEINCIFS